MLFKSVFKVSKSRSHVVNYSFKFILPCNYIYIYIFFQPMKANRLSNVTGFGGSLEILSPV